MIDRLTGAYNRHYLKNHIDTILQSAQKRKKQTGVIFFDIDYFKKVNDTYGHDVGDIVLQSLTKLVKTNLRREDVLIRYGGEEFVLFVNVEAIDEVEAIAQNLRMLIDKETFYHVKHITCSFGYALHQNQTSIDRTIKLADLGLYEAKKSGRNCVCQGFEQITLHTT